jgi:hypothetical protein
MANHILVTLFGGTVLAFPAEQKDDKGSAYWAFRDSLASAWVWLNSTKRWTTMAVKRIDYEDKAMTDNAEDKNANSKFHTTPTEVRYKIVATLIRLDETDAENPTNVEQRQVTIDPNQYNLPVEQAVETSIQEMFNAGWDNLLSTFDLDG